MPRRWWDVVEDLPLPLYLLAVAVTGALVLAGVAAPGVLGWYVGHRYFGHGDVGAFLPYLAAAFLFSLTDERMVGVYLGSVLAFLAQVPAIYLLLLVVRATLAASGLVRYAGPHAFLLTGAAGVLGGCGFATLATLKKTMEKAAEEGWRHLDVRQYFLGQLSVRVPLALVIASLTSLPPGAGARIVVGAYWGLVAAVCLMLQNALVDEDPIGGAWIYVVLLEVVLAFALVIGVLDGLFDHPALLETLELVPMAATTCFFTYGAVWLVATARAAIAARREAPAPQSPPVAEAAPAAGGIAPAAGSAARTAAGAVTPPPAP